MKFNINLHEENYTATVVEINNLNPVQGLDKLVQTSIYGANILVGVDTKLGDKGLFFPAECVLSHDFVANNNLYRHADLNVDKEKAGFFEDNCRVRSIKFKGIVSTGFFIPLNSLKYLLKNPENLPIGVSFQDIDGVNICRKFFRKVKVAGSKNQVKTFKVSDLVDLRCAPEHVDTDNLFRNMHKLNLDDIVAVSTKLHGCSLRVSRNIVYKPLILEGQEKWFANNFSKFTKSKNFKIKNLANRVAGRVEQASTAVIARLGEIHNKLNQVLDLNTKTYEYICASRRVIKSIGFGELPNKQHFYDECIWTKAGKLFADKLHKGENIYAEIVGWTDSSPIQGGYSYGIPQGNFDVYVYRISRSNEDGVQQDLSFPLLKERCAELGVKVVPEVFYGTLKQFIEKYTDVIVDERNYLNLLEFVVKENFLDKPSIFNSSAWSNVEEGIVMAKEQLGTFYYLKAKSPLFLLAESKTLDKESNIEDDESVTVES